MHQLSPGKVIGLSVRKRTKVRVVSPHGHQVVDTWVFLASSSTEYLSMAHNRTAHYRTRFSVGDVLVSNQFTPLLRFDADTTDGFHDSLHAACSVGSYAFFGETQHYPNCEDNLRETLRDHDIDFHITPPPWNLFEKSIVDEEGGLHDRATATKSGDYVELSAERDLLLIFSACRSTIGDISNGEPTGAEIWLEED